MGLWPFVMQPTCEMQCDDGKTGRKRTERRWDRTVKLILGREIHLNVLDPATFDHTFRNQRRCKQHLLVGLRVAPPRIASLPIYPAA